MTDQHQGRLFGEKEIGALLKRASELQDSGREPRTFGLTIAELRQVAEDAGIDPRYVDHALAESISQPTTGKRNWWGGPAEIRTSRVIDYEVDDSSWEAMVAEVRTAFKDTGSVDTWGNSLEWRHSRANGAQGHVQVSRRNGETRVDVFHKNPTATILSYIFASLLGLMMVPIIDEGLALSFGASLTTFLVSLAALFFVARFIVARNASGHDERFHKMADGLVQIAEEDRAAVTGRQTGPKLDGPAPEQVAEESTPEQRLDLDAAMGARENPVSSTNAGTVRRRTP